MCGDKMGEVTGTGGTVGSPPHVRGQVVAIRSRDLRSGITPACAGTSHTLSIPQNQKKDHPRMCGDKLIAFQTDSF